MRLRTRRAEPTDARLLAPMIYEAAPRMIDYVLGVKREEAIAFIAFCVEHDVGFYGYSKQYIGYLDDRPVIAGTVYESDQFTSLVWNGFLAVFRYFSVWHALRCTLRSLDVGRLYVRPRRDSVFMANFCVAEGHRGQGLFRTLFADFVLPFARERGAKAIEFDVGLDNPAAERLYRRLGFVPRATKEYRGRGDVEGVTRMTLAL